MRLNVKSRNVYIGPTTEYYVSMGEQQHKEIVLIHGLGYIQFTVQNKNLSDLWRDTNSHYI